MRSAISRWVARSSYWPSVSWCAALFAWRDWADRGGDRSREVARLSRARAAMGEGKRRAHHRIDQHDYAPGAACRQGLAVPRGGTRRPARTLRAPERMAKLPVLATTRSGARVRAHAVR